MWCAEQKLCQRGNSTGVSIPRPFLHQLGWLSGRRIVIELDDKQECLIIRLPRPSDYGPSGPPSIRLMPDGARV